MGREGYDEIAAPGSEKLREATTRRVIYAAGRTLNC